MRLTEEQLGRLFDQMPDSWPINQEHDLSRPPIGVTRNKRLERLPSGNLAIVADLEFNDEAAMWSYGGMSVSFTGQETIGSGVEAQLDAQLLYNPIHFDRRQIADLLALLDDFVEIRALEKHDKADEPVTILILVLLGEIVLRGFFEELGKDAYRVFKNRMGHLLNAKQLAGSTGAKGQLQFTAAHANRPYLVIVDLRPNQVEWMGTTHTLASARACVESIVGASEIERIAIRPVESEPLWEVIYFVDASGDVVRVAK